VGERLLRPRTRRFFDVSAARARAASSTSASGLMTATESISARPERLDDVLKHGEGELAALVLVRRAARRPLARSRALAGTRAAIMASR
jgi:hypothetical protein